MSDKILNTRVKQKIDTKANWDKAVNFVPLKGEIIVYSDLNKIKVGDGAKKVGELPFLADNDTKVTSAANHYTPTADSSAQLSVDASSTTTATWNSTQLVTGVNLQRDAKGHVTGVTVDSIKMPANPDTHQSIKTLNTSNTAAQTVSSSEAIAGSGTINLHKVAKTGSYNDLNNKPALATVATSGSYNDLSNKPDLNAYLPKAGGTLTGVMKGGIIDVHPENGGTILSYYTNDLAFLTQRGGSYLMTNTTTNKVLASSSNNNAATNMFDGSPSYYNFSVSAVTDTVVIVIKSPTAYSWSTNGGIGFGNATWRAKSVKIEMGYSATNKGTAQSPDSDVK